MLLIAIILSLLLQKLSTIKTNYHESKNDHEITLPSARKFIVVYVSLGFLVWLFQFGYSRYLIPNDVISSLYLFCLLEMLLSSSGIERVFSFGGRFNSAVFRSFLIISILTSVLAVVHVPDWGHASWRSPWIGVKVHKNSFSEDSLVLMLGSEPMSYVILYFPETVRFVRVQGNMVENRVWLHGILFKREFERQINFHKGTFFALFPASSSPDPLTIQNVHLKIETNQCTRILSNIEDFKLCRVIPGSCIPLIT